MAEAYLNNPLLKRANTQMQFTKKQVNEWIKCSEDPVYFAKKYVKIVQVDQGLIPFDMYDFQEDMMNKFHNNRFNIAKLPRQCGKSTTVIAYLVHYMIFNQNVTIGILANKASISIELLDKLQKSYENLPKWLQHGVISWNKKSVELDNGSRILAESTSSSAVRGMTFNIIFLDEFAFVPTHIAEQFFNSVYPTISSGKSTKVIIISTPNGMNMFYKLWHDAELGKNNYIPTEVHWSQVPGRDDAWKRQTIANTSPRQFEQEFECLHGDTIVTVSEDLSSKDMTMEELWESIIEKKTYYIYALKQNDEIKYIGQTINPDQRKRAHKNTREEHEFEVIFSTENKETAREKEIELIQEYNTYSNGWNKSPGGEGFEDYSRKGIGGVKKGTIPWNKGKSGCFSEETIEKFKKTRKGKLYRKPKLTKTQVLNIRQLYDTKPNINNVGLIMKNGKPMTYLQAFSLLYANKFNTTPQNIRNIITKRTWANV